MRERLQPEGRIIVLRNGRIIPGGWLPMAHAIGWTVSQDELFNELGCGGGATLFIDNIDQIDDAGEWARSPTYSRGVARSRGWRAVVTGGVGNDEWKTNLPPQVRNAGIAILTVERDLRRRNRKSSPKEIRRSRTSWAAVTPRAGLRETCSTCRG